MFKEIHRWLVVYIFFNTSRFCLSAAVELPFSLEEGEIVGYGDDVAIRRQLQEPILFWDKELTEVFVNLNGGIQEKAYTRIVADDNWQFFSSSMILPYWTDSYCLAVEGCEVRFKYATQADVPKIDAIVSDALNYNRESTNYTANPRKSFIVSFKNLPSYYLDRTTRRRNTFQTIVTSDGFATYIVFAYQSITYPTTSFAAYQKQKIGYYVNGNNYCRLDLSDTLQGEKLTCRTNIFHDGLYVIGFSPDAKLQCTRQQSYKEMVTVKRCSTIVEQVCASNGATYTNLCEFSKAKCDVPNLEVRYNGTCDSQVDNCVENICDINANCISSNNNFSCVCKYGYLGNGLTCSEINECNPNPCQNDQVCQDLVGTYTCHCQAPWTGRNCSDYIPCLTNNGGCEETCGAPSVTRPNRCSCYRKPIADNYQSCLSEDFLIVGLPGGISLDNPNLFNQRQQTLVPSEDINLMNNIAPIAGVDYDFESNDIFYIDIGINGKYLKKINRGQLQPPRTLAIANGGPGNNFGDVAFDSTTKDVYWAEDIYIKKLEQTSGDVSIFVKTVNRTYVRSILLLSEPCLRRIYWTQFTDNFADIYADVGIFYKDLNESASSKPIHRIIKEWVYQPLGLTADRENKKLIWIEVLDFSSLNPDYSNGIYMSNYDGSKRQQLYRLPGNTVSFGAVFYNGYVYFTTFNNFQVQRYDMKSNRTNTIMQYASMPTGIKMFGRTSYSSYCQNETRQENPCDVNNGGCEQTCVFIAPFTARCTCNSGYLAKNNRTCEINEPFVYFTQGYYIHYMSSKNTSSAGYHDLRQIVNVSVYDGVDTLAYDYNTNRLFFSMYSADGNNENHTIFSMYTNGTGMKNLTEELGPGFVYFLHYDYKRHRLFYSIKSTNENEFGYISDTDSEKPIKYSISSAFVRAMVQDDYEYFLSVDAGIFTWDEEANILTKVIDDLLTRLTALTIDRENKKLYFGELSMIERANYNGSCREKVATVFGEHILHISYFDNFLYWLSPGILYLTNVTGVLPENGGYATSEVLRKENTLQSNRSFYNIIIFKQPPSKETKNTTCNAREFKCYPYGVANGDELAPTSDDQQSVLFLSKPIRIFSKMYNQIYISPNGYLTFEAYTFDYSINLPYTTPIVSIYNADFYDDLEGDIYYRQTFDPEILTRISKDVQQVYQLSKFKASQAVIVTYYRLRRYVNGKARHDHYNTFQLTIASDNCTSYAINCYQDLESDEDGIEVTGYSESSCNWRQLRFNKQILLNQDRFVMSLHDFSCGGDSSCLNATNPTTQPTTTRPKTTTNPTDVMYPYGEDINDQRLEDRFYSVVNVSGGFPFLTTKKYELLVHRFGGLSDIDRETSVLGYYKFYDMARNESNVFYRVSTTELDKRLVAEDIYRAYPELRTSFYPEYIVVVSYINMADNAFATTKSTFQIVLATGAELSDLYIIFNYEQLGGLLGQAGYLEPNCIPMIVAPSYNLTQQSNIGIPGRWVFKPSLNDCKREPSVGTLKQSFYAYGPFEHSISLRNVMSEKPQVVLLQLISGDSYSNDFYVNSNLNDGQLRHAGMVIPYDTNQNYSQVTVMLAAIGHLEQTDDTRHGTIKLPPFTSRYHFYNHSFDAPMSDSPAIKITIEIPNRSLKTSLYTSAWLRNVTKYGFTVCYKEQMSFSGVRNITVHFIAFTKKGTEDIEANTVRFVKGPFATIRENNFMQFCEKIDFAYTYNEPPLIFITPEEDATDRGGVFSSWVHSVYPSHAVLCAKNSLDDASYERQKAIGLHYVIYGTKSPCSNLTCPSGLKCYVDMNDQPYCDCIRNCTEPSDDSETVCGSDLVTYPNLCYLTMESCLRYGKDRFQEVQVVYDGECTQVPYDSGFTMLEDVAGVPDVYCKYIPLMSGVFSTFETLQILLTVSWNTTILTNQSIHDATASWSEEVSLNGFKACVMVAGRHYTRLPDRPVIHWVAYQKSATHAAKYSLKGYSIDMNPWYTGSRCVELNVTGEDMFNPYLKFYVSVEHREPKHFQNAMTAWVQREHIMVPPYTAYRHSVCARELQNFDGLHRGVRLHVFGMRAPVPMHISEFYEVVFPAKYYGVDDPIPAVCKTVPYNTMFPVFADPTIVLTGVNSEQMENFQQFSSFSNHDMTVWLESNGMIDGADSMKVCLKSIRAGLEQKEMTVSYVLFPRYCQIGWYHHEGYCYKLLNNHTTYQLGKTTCESWNAMLPEETETMRISSLYFMRRLAGFNSLWIGATDELSEGNFVWENGQVFTSSKWKTAPGGDGKRAENCLIQTAEYFDDESCNNDHAVICVKHAGDIASQPCYGNDCSKRGYCEQNNGEARCVCNPGYVGRYCNESGSVYPECDNAVVHNEPSRLYTGVETKLNGRCDRNFESNTTWHRFIGVGGNILFTSCTNGEFHCGVRYPGWLNGSHPSEGDGIVTRTLHYYSHYCASDYGIVRIRNCGSTFGYVYQFTRLPYWSCDYGLCTTSNQIL